MEVDRTATNSAAAQTVECYRCGLLGHIARNCRTPRHLWKTMVRALTTGLTASAEEGTAEEKEDFPAARD